MEWLKWVPIVVVATGTAAGYGALQYQVSEATAVNQQQWQEIRKLIQLENRIVGNEVLIQHHQH